MEKSSLPNLFLRALATKTTRSENAFIARYPPSAGKMLDENVDLKNAIYLSE